MSCCVARHPGCPDVCPNASLLSLFGSWGYWDSTWQDPAVTGKTRAGGEMPDMAHHILLRMQSIS